MSLLTRIYSTQKRYSHLKTNEKQSVEWCKIGFSYLLYDLKIYQD
jgi:hypothetical protein